MLLTISSTEPGHGGALATDFGFVVHKHPQNVRSVSTTAGQAHVFWPEAEQHRATMALFVEVDSIGLVRRGAGVQPMAAYINDRPYVASSLLSVAIGRLFRSAMNGDCPTRPELVSTTWPVTVELPAVPVGADPGLVSRLFAPLGYEAKTVVPPLDPEVPGWGQAEVGSVTLTGDVTAQDLLRHLYVLLPVLDNDKHYWIDEAEVEKLLRHGDGWLADHPEHRLIVRRYLGNYKSLTTLAGRLLAEEDSGADQSGALGRDQNHGARDGDQNHGARDGDQNHGAATGDRANLDEAAMETSPDVDEAIIEKPLSLNQQRISSVMDAVKAANPSTVVDLGCGEGNLLEHLANETTIDRVIGTDVAPRSLQRAAKRLRLDSRPERQRPTVELRQSSLTYRDRTLQDIDVACLIEVIEHIDPPRLDAVEPLLFHHMRPRTVIVSTPNREYNELFALEPGSLRHRDHRFEWTRAEFSAWCDHIGHLYGYGASLRPIGPVDDRLGPPTQMAVLIRTDAVPTVETETSGRVAGDHG